ncbi:MAG: peptidylprolyl isomerase [Verrucomicrobia bacterium]|nr:peptidylprolyl isomerase [Verrucomicrobiota bacterium]
MTFRPLFPLVAALLLTACQPEAGTPSAPPAKGNPKVPAGAQSSGGRHAVLQLEKGEIELELFPEAAPRAVENFRLLAEHGYYDGLTFHRIIRGFMLQGGDPLGDGRGGQSAWGGTFADELEPTSSLYRAGYRRGIVAMANRGPNTNTSQFFIMHQDYRLPPSYVIFAKVIRGFEVVDALAELPTMPGPDGSSSVPRQPPVIRRILIKP